MESLVETINLIEEDYKAKKENLINLKYGAILIGFLAVIYSFFEIYKYKVKYELTNFEFGFAELFLIVIVLTPIIITPIYKFISTETYKKFNYKIKNSIFGSVLNEYTTDYNYSFKGTFSEKDLVGLNLNDSPFLFSKGNDLIIGKIKNQKFAISEYHLISLFKRKFDGLIGIIIFKEIETAERVYSRINSNLPSEGVVKLKENKLYLLLRGGKEHFEFRFSKNGINREELLQDYNFFEKFASLLLSEI